MSDSAKAQSMGGRQETDQGDHWGMCQDNGWAMGRKSTQRVQHREWGCQGLARLAPMGAQQKGSQECAPRAQTMTVQGLVRAWRANTARFPGCGLRVSCYKLNPKARGFLTADWLCAMDDGDSDLHASAFLALG